MGACIIGGAVALAIACEGLVIGGWRLAAGIADQDPTTIDLGDA